MMIYQKLITELMFVEQVCNFNCSYCMAPLNPIIFSNGKRMSKEKDGRIFELSASTNSILGKRMYEHIYKANKLQKTPILHLIGGELTLLKDLPEFIIAAAKEYEVVMLTTNGMLFNETVVDKLRVCENLVVLFSLDGHTFNMNSYRASNRHVHEKLLKNLDTCLKANIRVEVQMVLHDRNIKEIVDFADYLLLYAQNHYIKLVPFPVRWTQGVISLDGCNFDSLHQLYSKFESYKNVLPPKKYISNLIDFLTHGERTTKCYVPHFVFGVDDKGRIKHCPCIPSVYGTIWDDRASYLEKNEKEMQKYMIKSKCSGLCNTCFEGWELFNTYIQGDVDEDDIKCFFASSLPSSLSVLKKIKDSIQKS